MGYNATYTDARERFDELWEKAVNDREIITVNRRGMEDICIVAASELEELLETAHLLRSPKNAERLLTALAASRRGDPGIPMTIEELQQELGLGHEQAARQQNEETPKSKRSHRKS